MSLWRRPKISMAEPGTNPLEEPANPGTKKGAIISLIIGCLFLGFCGFSTYTVWAKGQAAKSPTPTVTPTITPSPIVTFTLPITATPKLHPTEGADPFTLTPRATTTPIEMTRIVTQIVRDTIQVPIYLTRVVNQTVVVDHLVTATPNPSYTPWPTYTPYPSLTPWPTYTSPAAAEPFPTYTPYPSLTPWPTPDGSQPTYTPYPTYTEVPTQTPWIIVIQITSTFTPEPTATNTPQPTQAELIEVPTQEGP